MVATVTSHNRTDKVTKGEVLNYLSRNPLPAPEERDAAYHVAVDVLLGRQSDVPSVDVVLCIVDASNLERNFYLVSQVLELGLPTVIALNMIDVAKDKGLLLDLEKLAAQLPVKFVPVQANRGIGVAKLKEALVAAAQSASLGI